VTAYGSYQAWAVPAPRRTRESRETSTTEAATLVEERWHALRIAGYLDDPRLERPHARTTVHTAPLATAAALLVLSALSLLAG
jgi:hypothetical protein